MWSKCKDWVALSIKVLEVVPSAKGWTLEISPASLKGSMKRNRKLRGKNKSSKTKGKIITKMSFRWPSCSNRNKKRRKMRKINEM